MNAQPNDDIEGIINRKLGTFIEPMNDQFERVLETVQSGTNKIPEMGERLEVIEHDVSSVKLMAHATFEDRKLIKARTEKHNQTLAEYGQQLKDHENRIKQIEKTA